MKIKVDTNLVSYSGWTNNDTSVTQGSFTSFNLFSSQSSTHDRYLTTDPFGNQSLVWRDSGITETPQVVYNVFTGYTSGGIMYVPQRTVIDVNKSYRFSVWYKIVSTGTTASPTGPAYYIGDIGYLGVGNTQTGFTLVTNGSYTTTPYGINTSHSVFGIDVWRLCIYYLRPYSWSGNTKSNETGIWSTNGTLISNASDYKFNVNCGSILHRSMFPWLAGKKAIYYACFPRMDEINGQEPSIATLLAGEGPFREAANIKIKVDTNLVSYSDWVSGGTASDFTYVTPTIFNHSIINKVDPFGNIRPILKKYNYNTSTETGGGWLGNLKAIDNTKTYRVSFWSMTEGSSLNTYTWMGIKSYISNGVTQDNMTLIFNGSVSTQKYMTRTYTGVLQNADTWYLHIGHIRPHTWTGTTNHSQSGVYSGTTGVNYGTGLSSYGDIKLSATTTYIKHYTLSPYVQTPILSGTTGITSYACYPRIDLVDGTEPSIATLLAGEGPFREAANIKIKLDTNLLDYSMWSDLTTGSTGYWTGHNQPLYIINKRIIDTDPFGNSAVLWQSSGITTGITQGGFNWYQNQNIIVDPTKNYRFSMWVNLKSYTGTTAFRFYFGCNTFTISSAASNIINKISGANAGATPYSISLNTTSLLNTNLSTNEWKLISFSLWNSGTTSGGSLYKDSGIWSTSGSRNSGVTADFIMSGNTYYSAIKIISPYTEVSTGSYPISLFAYPRIDEINGQEPSIATLLAGEGTWRDFV